MRRTFERRLLAEQNLTAVQIGLRPHHAQQRNLREEAETKRKHKRRWKYYTRSFLRADTESISDKIAYDQKVLTAIMTVSALDRSKLCPRELLLRSLPTLLLAEVVMLPRAMSCTIAADARGNIALSHTCMQHRMLTRTWQKQKAFQRHA